jgi:Tfp pilus assembly protein PilO
MIKKLKIIIFICVVALFCNIVAKLYFIDGQKNRIFFLQKNASAARSNSSIKPDNDRSAENVSAGQNNLKMILHQIPEEFTITQYAAGIRSLIDKNNLFVKDSLVFRPVKAEKSDLLLLKYNTNIMVTGSYGKIKNLISDIQNLPGIGYFNSAKLVRQKDNKTRVKLNLELSVFFKRGSA